MKKSSRKKIEETREEYLKRIHKIKDYKDWGKLRLKLLNKKKVCPITNAEFRALADLM